MLLVEPRWNIKTLETFLQFERNTKMRIFFLISKEALQKSGKMKNFTENTTSIIIIGKNNGKDTFSIFCDWFALLLPHFFLLFDK